jgi:hypothetical protein
VLPGWGLSFPALSIIEPYSLYCLEVAFSEIAANADSRPVAPPGSYKRVEQLEETTGPSPCSGKDS